MLELDFRKQLGQFTLDIQLHAGNETVGLLGASGAGKSMTLKCIAGIEKPDAGQIILDGRTLFDSEKGINLPPQQRNIGLLFQNYALFPQMTVKQNILTGLRRCDRRQRSEKLQQLLTRFHLEGLENRLPAQLSGGQQQRTAIARMLAAEPALLLFDEPFAALDSYLRWELEQVVAEVAAAHQGTNFFVSHNRDEAYRLCSRMAVLDEGSISVCDTREALFADPRTKAAALLTGCKNITPAQSDAPSLLHAPAWGLTLRTEKPANGCTAIGLHAHALHPAKDGEENSFTAIVRQVIDSPFSVIYDLLPQGGSTCLRWETEKNLPLLQIGDQVTCAVCKSDVLPLCDRLTQP